MRPLWEAIKVHTRPVSAQDEATPRAQDPK